ncbi:MAG: hypothetical protein JXR96_30930 [Deltaproteobacteria bacterium]|nr:hypothetical protein [Deltaproteobacteria bacterium]
MYADYQGRTQADCRESFPLPWVLAENALHLSTWVLAGWLVWPLGWRGWPLATMAWAVVVVLVQVWLKKHNCSGCYYYGKTCHLGWGRLSALLFEPDSGSLKTGMRLSFFYILSPPVFLLAGVLEAVFLDLGIRHWILLGVYVALNAVAFWVRLKGCRACALRSVCKGSAVSG